MSLATAALVIAAFLGAALLVWPAIVRTGLGPWHPAVAWLVLAAVFFGLGSAALALDGRPGPASYVAGGVILFGLAVAASDRFAARRARAGSRVTPRASALATAATTTGATTTAATTTGAATDEAADDLASLRPWVVAGLAAVGVLLIAPTLVRVGLPFLAGDITGARAELAGPVVQVLRVTVPALALALLLVTRGSETDDAARRRWLAWLAVGALIALEIVLASRYLAAELIAVIVVGVGLAGWQLRPRPVAALALVAVLAFGGIQVLRAYDQAAGRELAFAVERTVNRVVLIQPRTLEALQAAIPGEQPYFGGLTWLRRLGPALGRPDIPNLGYYVYPRIFPEQETPGYAAPGIFGEAWANFGPAGLALFAVLGLAAERLGAFLAVRRAAAGDLVAGALLVVFLARTHALGVNGLALLVGLVVVWRILAAGGLAGTWRSVRETLAWRV